MYDAATPTHYLALGSQVGDPEAALPVIFLPEAAMMGDAYPYATQCGGCGHDALGDEPWFVVLDVASGGSAEGWCVSCLLLGDHDALVPACYVDRPATGRHARGVAA